MNTPTPLRLLAATNNALGDLFTRLVADLFFALGYDDLRFDVPMPGRDTEEVRSDAAKLAETIWENERIRSLAENPLMLTTLMVVRRCHVGIVFFGETRRKRLSVGPLEFLPSSPLSPFPLIKPVGTPVRRVLLEGLCMTADRTRSRYFQANIRLTRMNQNSAREQKSG